jgi:hypothetical protein
MEKHHTHTEHKHRHSSGCGHRAVHHGDHVDYVHDGHLHHEHEGHVDECRIAVDTQNPKACTPGHACPAHIKDHKHGPGCGHDIVPHGDHMDFLAEGHLHHQHDGHCDDHGPLA